ncbi:MAG: hypothetical protein AVDCRST_MAG29-1790, partial [uncultured Nocardioidaceae bacterium]
ERRRHLADRGVRPGGGRARRVVGGAEPAGGRSAVLPGSGGRAGAAGRRGRRVRGAGADVSPGGRLGLRLVPGDDRGRPAGRLPVGSLRQLPVGTRQSRRGRPRGGRAGVAAAADLGRRV